jgi:hypothetical protein
MSDSFLPSIPYVSAALEEVQRIFPLKSENDLKVFGVLSVHNSISSFINDSSCVLTLIGAYSMDEALAINTLFLQQKLSDQVKMYKSGVMITSINYAHMVPVSKLMNMIDVIKRDLKKEIPDPLSKGINEMESYTRFVFEKALASPYEKGILTAVLARFRENIMKK